MVRQKERIMVKPWKEKGTTRKEPEPEHGLG